MALNWLWKNKCGEAVFLNKYMNEEYTLNLYEGNAFLIFIREWTEKAEDGKDCDMYEVKCFFVDEKHAKRCLGLEEDMDNILESQYNTLIKLRLDKSKCRNFKKIVDYFSKAYDCLTIETYKETERDD